MNPTKDEIFELFITEAKKDPRWKSIKFGKLEDGGAKHFVCYKYRLESFEEYSAVQKKYEPLTKAAIQRDRNNEEDFKKIIKSRRLALEKDDYKSDYNTYLKTRNLKKIMINGREYVEVDAIKEDYPAAYEECFASVKPDKDFTKHAKVREVLGTSTIIECYSCKGSTEVWCWSCSGRIWMKCNPCAGTGNGAHNRYNQEPYRCRSCSGKGKLRCGNCNSSGQVRCGKCSGIGQMRDTVRDTTCYFRIHELNEEMLRNTNGQINWLSLLYEVCGSDCSLVSGEIDLKFYTCKPKLKPLSNHSCKGIYDASVDYIKEHAEEIRSSNKKLGHIDEKKTEEGKNLKKDKNLKKKKKLKQVRNIKRGKRCGLRNARKNDYSDNYTDELDDDSSNCETDDQLDILKFGTDGYPLPKHRMLKQRHWVEEVPVTISVFHLPTKRTIFQTTEKSFVFVINGINGFQSNAIKETVLKDREWNNPCTVM